MWLYPIPALLSLGLWLYIFFTGPREGFVFSFAFLFVAVVFYFIFEKRYVKVPRGDVEGPDDGTRNA